MSPRRLSVAAEMSCRICASDSWSMVSMEDRRSLEGDAEEVNEAIR
ncbi:MAG: hypothetical protein OJF50_000557 [Nitrospira sp.]|nr:hypothetical protein [Nitrospira sp.]